MSSFYFKNILFIILTIVLSAGAIFGQTSSFTYQGRLTDGGIPASGNYDLQIALFDSAGGNTQIGQIQTISNVAVSAGVFTVTLDFGATAFPGASRFLEISMRPSGATAFTLLTPRQPITSTPYAVRSLNTATADTATNAQQLGGLPANTYVLTVDPRLSDSRPPTSGSSNYIQNTTTQQAFSNFNISGNGTVGGTLSGNIVTAATQFNIGGTRTLFSNGSFLEVGSGQQAIFKNNVGIGTFDLVPPYPWDGRLLHVEGKTALLRLTSTDAGSLSWDWQATSAGTLNLATEHYPGDRANLFSIMGNGYVGIGINNTAPTARLHVVDPGNAGLRVETNSAGGVVGSFGKFGDFKIDAVGASGGRFVVKENGNVGIGTAFSPPSKLYVAGDIKLEILGSGGTTQLCYNNAGAISFCSSSLRYKTDLQAFNGGLNLINRLHPITFKWKSDQSLDLGLGAEDVAAVEPLLVTRNQKGEVEGVKYDRLSAVFINAFKEQQDQLASLRTENDSLNERLQRIEKALKKHSVARHRRR